MKPTNRWSMVLCSSLLMVNIAQANCDIPPIPQPYYKDVDCLNEGLAVVTDEQGHRGFIDGQGNTIIPATYDMVKNFSDGMAQVYQIESRKWGYINKHNQLVIDYQYDESAPFKLGVAVVANHNKYYLIDKKNNVKSLLDYDNANFEFFEGYAVVIKNDKYGFIDTSANIAIPLIYDFADDFKQGIAKVGKSDKYGFIDKSGKVIIPLVYDEVWGDFAEGLVSVRQGKKWGYIDKQNQVILPLIYDYAFEFENGRAIVIQGKNRISIDKHGKLIEKLPNPAAY